MIKKYVYGEPFETEAVTTEIEAAEGMPEFGFLTTEKGFHFTYTMDKEDVVFGLGENMHGINKRGHLYVSDCMDDINHTEDRTALYCAHNFLVVSGRENFGLFIDYPGTLKYDIGFTKRDILTICCDDDNLYLYVITGENAYDITKQFRKIIGRSYIPPKFAFGYGQSRCGYKTQEDFFAVLRGHRENHVPLDMIYMDIDYMDHYKDFTVNPEYFPDLKAFVDKMKAEKIHLVPIIDAGVKVEAGYDVYDEGAAKGYFCRREDGSYFVAHVWPGATHFPDVLNKEARAWFGSKYKYLTDAGIDGFWNDMNEPSIFYSEEGMEEAKEKLSDFLQNSEDKPFYFITMTGAMLAHNRKDYERFYHNVDGKMVRHDKVHNLFGYNMTRAAGEAFETLCPDRRILIFSRSSYIGMHRYGGIWTGDNKSWWTHLLLNIKMMPSLNMCGFLYSGADLGGFGSDTERELLLRWLAFGLFTPLMRNHCGGRREQEVYQFEEVEDFRHVIGVRYRLLPYIYSEYMKAALQDDMYFKPLAFVYPEDKMALEVEDQLMIGNEIMITPVYTQHVTGRYVYLPEEMKFIKFMPDGTIYEKIMGAGHHYITVELNEVPLFIRKDKAIPLVDVAETVSDIDMSTKQMIGYPDAAYDLYEDDGVSRV